MNRTLRAALVAGLIGLVGVGGVALLLGVPFVPALIAGVVADLLFSGLILAAARRAESFDSTEEPRG